VKKVLDELNKKIKDEGKGEPLSAVELADITKLITDAHGYK
jgi:flagellar biosynthesis/type III secretory pathway M-ring protein FliF/YscJ